MGINFPTKQIREGAAKILIPKIILAEKEPFDHAMSRAPVFYNPRMRLNRDTAVLALGVYQRSLSSPILACEPMCGTGVRGIRLVLEVAGVEGAVLSDLNPKAVMLAEKNVDLNNVSNKIKIRLMDANLIMSLHDRPFGRFDYVDLDPFGSPSPYLDSAVRTCRKRGMIALTATDLAPLCGVNPKACLRKYGGLPLRTKYSHDVALRLLTGALVNAAVKHDVAVRPVFSYIADHYARLYAVIEQGARKADHCLDSIGYIFHCSRCLNRRFTIPEKRGEFEKCDLCGSQMKIGGPMWISKLADRAFCGEMLELAERSAICSHIRLMKIIRLVQEEIGFGPTFYDIDVLCSRLKIASLSINHVLSALRNAGLECSKTHIDKRGVRTNASIFEVKNVLKGLAEKRDQGKSDVT